MLCDTPPLHVQRQTSRGRENIEPIAAPSRFVQAKATGALKRAATALPAKLTRGAATAVRIHGNSATPTHPLVGTYILITLSVSGDSEFVFTVRASDALFDAVALLSQTVRYDIYSVSWQLLCTAAHSPTASLMPALAMHRHNLTCRSATCSEGGHRH